MVHMGFYHIAQHPLVLVPWTLNSSDVFLVRQIQTISWSTCLETFVTIVLVIHICESEVQYSMINIMSRKGHWFFKSIKQNCFHKILI